MVEGEAFDFRDWQFDSQKESKLIDHVLLFAKISIVVKKLTIDRSELALSP